MPNKNQSKKHKTPTVAKIHPASYGAYMLYENRDKIGKAIAGKKSLPVTNASVGEDMRQTKADQVVSEKDNTNTVTKKDQAGTADNIINRPRIALGNLIQGDTRKYTKTKSNGKLKGASLAERAKRGLIPRELRKPVGQMIQGVKTKMANK